MSKVQTQICTGCNKNKGMRSYTAGYSDCKQCTEIDEREEYTFKGIITWKTCKDCGIRKNKYADFNRGGNRLMKHSCRDCLK